MRSLWQLPFKRIWLDPASSSLSIPSWKSSLDVSLIYRYVIIIIIWKQRRSFQCVSNEWRGRTKRTSCAIRGQRLFDFFIHSCFGICIQTSTLLSLYLERGTSTFMHRCVLFIWRDGLAEQDRSGTSREKLGRDFREHRLLLVAICTTYDSTYSISWFVQRARNMVRILNVLYINIYFAWKRKKCALFCALYIVMHC